MKRPYMRERLSQFALIFRPPVKTRALLFKKGSHVPTAFAANPTPLDIANYTDALLALEVRYGCFGQIESRLAALREIILGSRMVYAATPADVEAVDRVWINFLRLGLFDELLHLTKQYDLPLKAEVKTFIDFCARQYAVSHKRGEAYRAKHPDGDIFMLGCIVWGDVYVGNFLRYNVRSMLSANNLPALCAQGKIVFSIVTDAAGEQHMRRHPSFGELTRIGDVEFTIIPDEMIQILSRGHLVRNFYILYGMLDHCSIFFAQGAGCHLFMIPVDSIVADGSLNNMANYRHDGYECCGGGNLVANTETFLPALDAMFDGEGPIAISTEDLATLAAEHAHHYFTSQIVAKENQDFGKHPREIFWPIEGGVEIHSVFIHPLFTTASGLAHYKRMHYANIDYGMIPRLFAGAGRIKIIDDPRQAYVNNFTAADRLYETTGKPFDYQDFLRSHDYSYPVQKRLFTRAQHLPCRLKGWTAYRHVADDVREIAPLLKDVAGPAVAAPETGASELTIILPTHNRPDLCKTQVRFLKSSFARHHVIVADSSDVADERLREACTGTVEYRRFEPTTAPGVKLMAVARSVTTPYVAMVTDDDISFPHAIDACVDYLQRNPDYVVAQGYVLAYAAIDTRIDIHSVLWFIGSIAEATPLRRLYELMRRYQPFFWAVFRTDAYILALDRAGEAKGAFFHELTFAATLAVLGKLARLPMIQTLRGEEESNVPAARGHPFFWFLDDSSSFFGAYAEYRDSLIGLLQQLEGGKRVPRRGVMDRLARLLGREDDGNGAKQELTHLRHVLDIIHASYFGREVDTGLINHRARMLLGDALEPLPVPKPPHRDLAIGPGDVMHNSAIPGRSYVWRDAVVNAEPKSEISISPEEIARVEAALDDYLPPIASVLTVLTQELIARAVQQWADAENVDLQSSGNVTRVIETSGHGYHRLIGRIWDRYVGNVGLSLLAKFDGLRKVKLELHDDQAAHYVSAVFDLKSGEKLSSDEVPSRANISPAGDGYFRLSLGLPPLRTDTHIHFTVTFLDAADATIYPGRAGVAILLRDIDIR